MTIEEAISHLQEARKYPVSYSEKEQEAYEMAFTVLRALDGIVTDVMEGMCYDCIHDGSCCDYSGDENCKDREEDGSCWTPHRGIELDRSRWSLCKECWKWLGRYDFCPECGHPFTEKAWGELERRINDGSTD